jgi:4-diphosphocytidyl-2C-methyl-D-erythritol kinase
MFNVFEEIAFAVIPGLNKYRKALEEAGAAKVYLTGSGPCLFALFSTEEEARKLFSRIKKQGLECYLASSLLR